MIQRFDSLDARLGSLATQMVARYDSIETRLDSHYARITAQYSQVQSSIVGLSERLNIFFHRHDAAQPPQDMNQDP